MCFVSGRADMGPMRSHIIHELGTKNTQREMTFWYRDRSKKEMFFNEEFKELAEKHSNFSYHTALSEPQPEDH